MSKVLIDVAIKELFVVSKASLEKINQRYDGFEYKLCQLVVSGIGKQLEELVQYLIMEKNLFTSLL